ncbi:hypothetical protein HaLaN_16257 [Haematococcus lacustris]|uniref:Uncharacterized protein n=1 Tax=Haematococcus lacustris TaxID=44745 RepID=A0A699ZC62_HAELA|nr:hypothetical protein HaLaN_16257 [Haematococcus lacustris]
MRFLVEEFCCQRTRSYPRLHWPVQPARPRPTANWTWVAPLWQQPGRLWPGEGVCRWSEWRAKAVREGFRKVLEQPSMPSTFDRPDRLVIVDEFRLGQQQVGHAAW